MINARIYTHCVVPLTPGSNDKKLVPLISDLWLWKNKSVCGGINCVTVIAHIAYLICYIVISVQNTSLNHVTSLFYFTGD